MVACIPETEIAYHASQANSYSLGVEVCHPDWTGEFGKETYESLISLLAELCEEYRLNPMKDIRRHYDITGKDCPRYYVKHNEAWEQLKKDVGNKMQYKAKGKIKILLNGKVKEVEGLCEAGVHYIKLRDLADERIVVDYDEGRKMAVVRSR